MKEAIVLLEERKQNILCFEQSERGTCPCCGRWIRVVDETLELLKRVKSSGKDEAIALLEKDAVFYDSAGYGGPRVSIPRGNYDQLLAILKQPKCKTCGDTKEIEERGYSDEGVFVGYIKKPCPKCQPSSELSKEK